MCDVMCYTWSLVHSECLNDSVADTVWIGIAGCYDVLFLFRFLDDSADSCDRVLLLPDLFV
jgi:hypothetical protein